MRIIRPAQGSEPDPPKKDRAYSPHCDSSILHAPDTCPYCDEYPDWQELRVRWRMNFTNEYDIDKAPCPSVYFRNPADRDAWPGNRPEGYDWFGGGEV